MRKNVLRKMGALGLAVALGVALAGCNQPSMYPAEPVNSETVSVTVSSEEKPSEPGESGQEVKDINTDPEQIRMLFDSFLNGGDKIKVDIAEYENSYNVLYVENGASYDINQFVENIDAKLAEGYESGEDHMYVQTIDFAEIDCGNDGIPEMALYLTIDFDEPRVGEQDIYVAKVIDGQITIVTGYSFGYRGFGELNKYGTFHHGGSGGANLFVDGYDVITAEGEPVMIYECDETYALKQPMIYSGDLPEGYPSDYPEMEFEEGGYTQHEYLFEIYPAASNGNDPLSDAFARSKMYVFSTEDGEVVYPSDDLMAIYKELGMTVTDFDTVNKKIDARKAAAGFTDEMMTSPEDDSSYTPAWRIIYEKNITEGQGGEN